MEGEAEEAQFQRWKRRWAARVRNQDAAKVCVNGEMIKMQGLRILVFLQRSICQC